MQAKTWCEVWSESTRRRSLSFCFWQMHEPICHSVGKGSSGGLANAMALLTSVMDGVFPNTERYFACAHASPIRLSTISTRTVSFSRPRRFLTAMSRNFPSSRTPKSVCQQVTVVRFVEAEACAYLPTQMTSGLELVARVVPFLHLVLLLSEPAKSALAVKNATVMVAARRGPAVGTVGG